MLDLNDLYYFATLAERGSFTAAAEMLGVPKGSLSRRLQNLEAQLDLRLIDRTTRRFALTEAGESLYLYARQIVEHAQAAESNLRSLLGEPIGRVRMTCPQGILRTLLVPLLPEFLALYPKVNVDIVASSRYVDLIADGFDLGLRSHERDLVDSSLVARRLAVLQMVLVASPTYVDTRAITEPADIEGADGLHMESQGSRESWTLQGPDGAQATVRFKHRLGSDDVALLKAAAIAGHGIAVSPLHSCQAELRKGTLIRVLPRWDVSRRNLSLILPAQKGLMPAVRAFADFLIERVPALVEGPPPATAIL